MKLEPRIILKLFLNLSDFEPQYTFQLYYDIQKQHNILVSSFTPEKQP